jgi:hypothetical protein
MLTGVVAMSPVVSAIKNIILIEKMQDAKSCNDCSIITRGAGRTQ